SIVATFGPETEEPEIVAFAIDGIKAGDETRGHRFMAPQPFKVRRFEDYAAKLEKAKVVLDPDRRKEMILADAKNLAFAQGYELVEDAGLLAEIAGLVEWPVVLMGSFDDAFLRMPPEIVRATIRNNQKCFVLREERTSQLADTFILVANIEAEDRSVAAACEAHYKPLGPNERVPTDQVSLAVALAEKIDLLECFWILHERPTGSKNPYALRRAALGVVRIILEKNIRVALRKL